jgi:diguanylate cyclase (GGDEF)-like protein
VVIAVVTVVATAVAEVRPVVLPAVAAALLLGPVAGIRWSDLRLNWQRWLPLAAWPAAFWMAAQPGPTSLTALPLAAVGSFAPGGWWLASALLLLVLSVLAPGLAALAPAELVHLAIGLVVAVGAIAAAERLRQDLRLAAAHDDSELRRQQILFDDRTDEAIRALAPDAMAQRRRDQLDELEKGLQSIVGTVRRALGAHAAFLYLRNDRDLLELRAFDCLVRDIEATAELRPGDGVIGWVFKQAEPFLAAEYQKSISGLTHYRHEVDLRSFLAVPIVDQDCLGVLAVDSLEIQAFGSEEQRQLLEVMADQVVRWLRHWRERSEGAEDQLRWKAFYEAAQDLLQAEAGEHAVRRMLDLIDLVVPSDLALVAEEVEPGTWRIADMQSGYPSGLEPGAMIEGDASWAGWALAQPEIRDVADLSRRTMGRATIADGEDLPAVGSVVCLPFNVGSDLDLRGGGLVLWSLQTGRYGAAVIANLRKLMAPFHLAWGRARAMERLRDQATTDGLTRLANRRTALEHLAAEIERADRTGLPVSVMLLDVDHFKKVNDTHGHGAGDDVLRQVAEALRAVFRTTDRSARLRGRTETGQSAPARYGGEEFLVVMPDTGEREALVAAERARKAIASTRTPLETGGVLKVSASFGVASYIPQSGEPIDRLLQRADEALYAAKDAGRNRVAAAVAFGGNS